MRKKKIVIISAKAGNGHTVFADIVKEMVETISPKFDIVTMDYWEFLQKPTDPPKKKPDQGLNQLPYWIIPLLQRLQKAFFYPLLQICRPLLEKRILKIWKQQKPDYVISVICFLNQLFRHSLKKHDPSIKYLTVIADYDEFIPESWAANLDQYCVCPTEKFYQTLLQWKIPPQQLLKTTGFLIPQKYYAEPTIDLKNFYAQFGFRIGPPTILLYFGNWGDQQVLYCLKQLDKCNIPLQAFAFLSDQNAQSKETYRNVNTHFLSYTNELEKFLTASDLLIGKPGPGTVSQSIKLGTPVAVLNNRTTMFQERYVANWVEKENVGLAISHLNKIPYAIEILFKAGHIDNYRQKALGHENHAYSEVFQFLKYTFLKES